MKNSDLCISLVAVFLTACAGTKHATPAAQTALTSATPAANANASATSALALRVRQHLRGAAATLTLDDAIERIVDSEVERVSAEATTMRVFAVVLDPRSGHVLAMSGREHGQSAAASVDLAARVVYEPASVTKVFTVAAALDRRAIRADQSFSCENGAWQRPDGVIHDASAHGDCSVGDILAFSSNIGTAKIYGALGKDALQAAFGAFGLVAAPPLQLPDVAAGGYTRGKTWSTIEEAGMANGHSGLRANPVAVAAAFAAVANDGVYVAPTLARDIRDETGQVTWHHDATGTRVISHETASTMMRLLEDAVHRDDATGTTARIEGVRVAGKTGTGTLDAAHGASATYATFVGAFPAERPRFVVLTSVITSAKGYTGASVAAPLFAAIGRALLTTATPR